MLLAVSACDGSGAQHDTREATHADSAVSHADTAAGDLRGATAHADHADSGEALLPIMQRLGSSMNALTYGLMTDDYATVESSAAAIARHAPISAEELERIETVLGAEAAQFEEFDVAVHDASVRLHQAAGERRPEVIVERLAEVQRGCVGCHARFRDRLRTAQ